VEVNSLAFAAFIGVSSLALAQSATAQVPIATLTDSSTGTPINPFTGGAPLVAKVFTAELNGQTVTIMQVAAYYHHMDLRPGDVQPIGLEAFINIMEPIDVVPSVSEPTGHAKRCGAWVQQVNADEFAWTPKSPTFPYLEIDIAPNSKPITLSNGAQVFQDEDVRCWESMDFGPPFF
jgi:hypothetical protein